MISIFARAAARFIPNTLGKAWTTITTAKDGYEIYDGLKTVISEMSTPAKVGAVVAAAGLASAPFVIPAAIQTAKEAQTVYEYIPPSVVSVHEDSPQKVYPAAYLLNNRHLLSQMLISCKTDPTNVVERCTQARIAEDQIYSEILREKLRNATRLDW